MLTINSDNSFNSLSKTTASKISLKYSGTDLPLSLLLRDPFSLNFYFQGYIKFFFDGEIHLFWMNLFFSCDQSIDCSSKSPSSHKANNSFFRFLLFSSQFDHFQIVFLAHLVRLYSKRRDLFI